MKILLGDFIAKLNSKDQTKNDEWIYITRSSSFMYVTSTHIPVLLRVASLELSLLFPYILISWMSRYFVTVTSN